MIPLLDTATAITKEVSLVQGVEVLNDGDSFDFDTHRFFVNGKSAGRYNIDCVEYSKREYYIFWANPCVCIKQGNEIEYCGQRYEVLRAIPVQDENSCDYAQKILTTRLR